MSKFQSVIDSNEGKSKLLKTKTVNQSLFNTLGAQDDIQETTWFSVPLVLFLGLVIFIGWAAIFEIDQSVRATGLIIPGGRTQIIQAADGGVLAEILVQEGEFVTIGQRLATLEKERINATFKESRSNVAALSVALERAQAEVSEKTLKFSDEFNDFPTFIDAQRNLYQQRRKSLNDELKTLQVDLNMAKAVLDIQESLMASGSTSKLEVMNARQKVNEVQGIIIKARNKYLNEAYQEMTKLEADLDIARHKQDERQSVLEQTDINAPVTGIIKSIKLTTLGGVLRQGDELMQISPTESGMIVEVKINPVDIGQLSLGMPASIKLDAFDYSIYGSLKGTLSYISSDTLEERVGEETVTYYRARINLDEISKSNNHELADVVLKPGMTTSIDIQTNKRTVLAYLVKPVTRAFGGAFNER